MSKKWRLTERTRTLLTLELAIVLPAAALMGFSIWNLKHIQRSEALEAAIQRDFSHVLKIAERKSWEEANEALAPIRREFPNSDEGQSEIKAKLERILSERPEYAYTVLYDKNKNLLVSRTQPGRDRDPGFCALAGSAIQVVQSWLPLDAPDMAANVRSMAEKDEPPVGFYGASNLQVTPHVHHALAYFIPPGVPKDRVVLGVVAFDDDYLRKSFLLTLMKDVLTSKSSVLRTDANPPVMMIHPSMDPTPWVTSAN